MKSHIIILVANSILINSFTIYIITHSKKFVNPLLLVHTNGPGRATPLYRFKVLKRADINKSGGAATPIYLRFMGVHTHIYKTAVRSLYLIYIAVLALADLRDLHDTFTVSPFRLCPPMPTELFTTALRRRALTSSEPLSQPVVSPSSLYILYHTQSHLSTLFDIIFLFNLVAPLRSCP